jgi:hypothetical protein
MILAAAAALLAAAPASASDGPLSGEVTAVSVMPSPGRAEIVVNVHGTVDVKDFMLQNPDRLVLDVVGARLSATASRRASRASPSPGTAPASATSSPASPPSAGRRSSWARTSRVR